MPFSENREYRTMATVKPLEEETEEKSYKVRGYASTFDPYVLFEDADGIEYKEHISPSAFDEADVSDVIFQFDHEGRVFARTRNGSLKTFTDEHGFGIEADLGLTPSSRELYEEIKAGLIDRMSFAFTVREDAYDKETRTRNIYKIKKVYDVSAVSLPANEGTSISVATRKMLDGAIEQERAERLEGERKERAKKVLALRMKIGGYINGNQ